MSHLQRPLNAETTPSSAFGFLCHKTATEMARNEDKIPNQKPFLLKTTENCLDNATEVRYNTKKEQMFYYEQDKN